MKKSSVSLNADSGRGQSVKMSFEKRLIVALLKKLEHGCVRLVDGDEDYTFGNAQSELKAQVNIVDPQTYKRMLYAGSIGAAEAYVEGQWNSPDPTQVIRIFSRNLPALAVHEKRFGWLAKPFQLFRHWRNRNDLDGSRTNIAAHYDLGNEMYRLFLDPHMQYSSALFPAPEASLEAAQIYKLKVLCEKLELSANDHLLEIGTGWGGLACYAAKHYGCKVTSTTISEAQYEVASERVKAQGLQGQVTLLLDDYRELQGAYSKIVSVEMIEAVGHAYLPEYFRVVDQLLAPGGRLLLQAITIEDQRYEEYRKDVDFIQQYIFPGGHLPSPSEILRHVKEQTNLRLVTFMDYGDDYANTLKEWRKRFMHHRHEINAMGFSDDFIRLWEYYFAYSEGGFREAAIGLAHLQFEKRRYTQ